MAPIPLEILKKGFTKYSQKIHERKNQLITKLSRHEILSPDDEEWLDHEGNTAEEQRVLDNLEAAVRTWR